MSSRSRSHLVVSIMLLFIMTLCGCRRVVNVRSAGVITGSGKVAQETRAVAGFDAIVASSNGKVIVEIGTEEGLVVVADDNLLSFYTAEVKGSTLYLGQKPDTSVNSVHGVEFRVKAKSLRSLSLSGNVTAQVSGLAEATFTATLTSNNAATVAGRAERQEVTVNGNSRYTGDNLTSKHALAKVDGNSRAVLRVSDTLDATVSGNSTLEYIGNPQATRDVKGTGQLRRR